MIISSKEYALEVSDIVSDSIEDALMRAFDYITKRFGCIEDYDTREVRSLEMIDEFQERLGAEWRGQAIGLFEEFGMDIQPDGSDW